MRAMNRRKSIQRLILRVLGRTLGDRQEKDGRFLKQMIRFLSKMDEKDRKLLLFVTAKMAKGKEK